MIKMILETILSALFCGVFLNVAAFLTRDEYAKRFFDETYLLSQPFALQIGLTVLSLIVPLLIFNTLKLILGKRVST